MARNYKVPKIEELLDAGVHFGHQVRRWHPDMEPFIYTQRSGIHVINLEKTHENLEKAADFLYDTAARGGQIVFVGTKKQAREIIELEANRCGAMFVTERWLGGTITNFKVIRKNINKLVDLINKRDAGEFQIYTKKERLLIDREIEKLNGSIGGIVGLKGTPDAVFVVDGRREKTAVREAYSFNVPVVGLVDTNTNPEKIDYVIPGNDDAIRSIVLIAKTLSDAVEEGYKEYAKKLQKGEIGEGTEEKEDEETSRVTGTEAPHSTEEKGKAHLQRVKEGAEEIGESVEVEGEDTVVEDGGKIVDEVDEDIVEKKPTKKSKTKIDDDEDEADEEETKGKKAKKSKKKSKK